MEGQSQSRTLSVYHLLKDRTVLDNERETTTNQLLDLDFAIRRTFGTMAKPEIRSRLRPQPERMASCSFAPNRNSSHLKALPPNSFKKRILRFMLPLQSPYMLYLASASRVDC